MTKALKIGIIVGVVFIIGAALLGGLGGGENEPSVTSNPETSTETRVGEGVEPEGLTGTQEESLTEQPVGAYFDYEPSLVSRASEGDVVIFFAASWCPSCQALNRNIEANIENIPASVTLLKADYDSEVELRQTYGVTTQHTLVQVDAQGNQIAKWSGGSTLESVLEEIQ